jgi:hypothetical protein
MLSNEKPDLIAAYGSLSMMPSRGKLRPLLDCFPELTRDTTAQAKATTLQARENAGKVTIQSSSTKRSHVEKEIMEPGQ